MARATGQHVRDWLFIRSGHLAQRSDPPESRTGWMSNAC